MRKQGLPRITIKLHTMDNDNTIVEYEGKQLDNVNDLKQVLATTYRKQIDNYFGDEKKALRFLSSVVSAVQRTPKLLECEPSSVINSFMTMAQLELMPSDVSGEAYILPYKGVAQFQLGYQGLVTLFYRSGAKDITAEIVYKNDTFKYINGEVLHEPDVFNDDRGEPIGAYVIVTVQSGGKVTKVMSKKDILTIGKKFSKSFGTKFSPWDSKNDPELWMWKKTVLKQAAKLVPKNTAIVQAIAEDNKDSVFADRVNQATEDTKSITMGNLVKHDNKNQEPEQESEQYQEPTEDNEEPPA